MATYTRVGDRLHGQHVVCTYRTVRRSTVYRKTAKHRGQRIVLERNVECVIEKESSALSRREEKES